MLSISKNYGAKLYIYKEASSDAEGRYNYQKKIFSNGNTLFVGPVGCGKSNALNFTAWTMWKAGYTVVYLTEKDNSPLENAFCAFPVNRNYQKKLLEKMQLEQEIVPTKIYHPFTFKVPYRQKFPDNMRFFTFGLKSLTEDSLSSILAAGTAQDSQVVRVCSNIISRLKSNDDIYKFVRKFYELLNSEDTEISSDPRDMGLPTSSAIPGDRRDIARSVSAFSAFYDDFFLQEEECQYNISMVDILNEQENMHFFTGRWIENERLRYFYQLLILEQINEAVKSGQVKRPICLEENTEIMTTAGSFKLKDLPEKFDVYSWDFNKSHRNIEIDHATKFGGDIKEVFEMKLEDGKSVEATAEHIFFVKEGDKIVEKKLKDIKIGDEIAIKETWNNRWCIGHKSSEKRNAKASIAMKKKWKDGTFTGHTGHKLKCADPIGRSQKISKKLKGRPKTALHIENMRKVDELRSKRISDTRQRKFKDGTLKIVWTPERLQKRSDTVRQKHLIDSSYGQHYRNGLSYEQLYGEEKSIDIKKKIGFAGIGHVVTQETKDKIIKANAHLYARRKGKTYVEIYGQDRAIEILSKILIFPNQSELRVLSILEKHFENEWKYVGDGTFLIEHKNPDFINAARKICIEYYASHYKRENYGSVEDYETQRAARFLKAGWKTIFIRDKINENDIVEKVKNAIQ